MRWITGFFVFAIIVVISWAIYLYQIAPDLARGEAQARYDAQPKARKASLGELGQQVATDLAELKSSVLARLVRTSFTAGRVSISRDLLDGHFTDAMTGWPWAGAARSWQRRMAGRPGRS